MSARRRAGLAAVAGQFVWSAQRRWRELPPDRRRRLQALLRKSGGRPSALSAAERQELGRLMRELELVQLFRNAATSAASEGRFGRRW